MVFSNAGNYDDGNIHGDGHGVGADDNGTVVMVMLVMVMARRVTEQPNRASIAALA